MNKLTIIATIIALIAFVLAFASISATLIMALIKSTLPGVASDAFSVLCKPPALPVVAIMDRYWGPGSPVADASPSVKPFKVVFKDDVVADLKERLSKHRPFTPPLEGAGFEYGFNTDYLYEVVSFWKDNYDFKAREKFLNSYPQYVTTIQGLQIHFLHVKPEKSSRPVTVMPLLLLHSSSPGSVREFYEMIPLLTTPQEGREFVFEVIVPSLPGYGFSQGSSKPGLGMMEVAIICRNLMTRLSISKFVVQGGDVGSVIGSHISTLFPNDVVGYHTNSIFPTPCALGKWLAGALFPSLVAKEKYVDRMYPMFEKISTFYQEISYVSKPDTVGVGLNDSPVGLAAHILNRFSTSTNHENKKANDGKLTQRFKMENLIDNVMIYWTSGSITTSMRLYAEPENETTCRNEIDLYNTPTEVPTAIISFKYELFFLPSSFYKEKFSNLVQHTIVEHTGLFAALESPEVLAKDLIAATEKFIQFSKKK